MRFLFLLFQSLLRPVWPILSRFGLFFALPGLLTAQAPLRVAIVGLEHGHVEGLLRSLPSHGNVQLVGIADADPALFAKYQDKYSDCLRPSFSRAWPT